MKGNMLLNNEGINSEIKEEIKRYLQTNENEDTTIQNLWDTGKPSLRGKFIALEAYCKTKQNKNKRQEKVQINNLTSHFKELEKAQSPQCVEGRK